MNVSYAQRTAVVVEVLPDQTAIARRAADVITVHRRSGQLRTLGVATGSSPTPIYTALAHDAATDQATDWADIRLFALDEYVGLPPGHPESYRSVIEQQVAGPLGVPEAYVHVPDGAAGDLHRAAEDFEHAIAGAGGVDLQILGIGANGHIGFNEPGSSLTSRTRVVQLSEQTRRDNARFFPTPAHVPHQALTQGIATIAQARRHLLVAHGANKAAAVHAMLHGPLGPQCPASAVRSFADVLVLLDPAAARLLHPTAP